MKKKLITVLCIAAALILLICLLPWPSKMDITMHGAKVTEDGAVLDEGEIVIRGWRLNYLLKADRFAASEVEILDLHFATELEHSLVVYDESYLPYEWITGLIYRYNDGTYVLSIALDPAQEWCFIRTSQDGDAQYFVGSPEEGFDPLPVLETCADLIS